MSTCHLPQFHFTLTVIHFVNVLAVAGQPRSLCEMVGEEGVWQHLHSSFTWLLKASGLRLQERLVEGPPISTFMSDCSDECGGELMRAASNE